MQKNKFCIIPKKSLKNIETGNFPSHFIIYKKKEKEYNPINQNTKINDDIYLDDIFIKNYNISKRFLSKYNKNIDILSINSIIQNKKCHLCVVYKDTTMFNNIQQEYIKKYYNYNDSIKIIPKRQAYFKHLMIYIEGPVYKNFFYNQIIKRKSLEKLNFYKRTNYPEKFHKKHCPNINNLLSDSNIIFNTNVIETIENCSTSLTQGSNKKNNEKKNINESIISEIKIEDNSLFMIKKDLSINRNIINNYLCKHNNNYKKLYNKMKSKSKAITIANDNKLKEEKELNEIKNENDIKKNKLNQNKNQLILKNDNNLVKSTKQKKARIRGATSLIKKLNKMKISQLNLINIKSSSQIEKNNNNNINSCSNFNKYGLSLVNQNQINNNAKRNNKKSTSNDKTPILFNYFNNSNKKIESFFNKNKNNFKLNNQFILKSIKKIIEHQRPKNNSLKKYINTQKFLTDSTNYCLININSSKENQANKKFQTINPVKSISISNNQFFKYIKDFQK